MFLQESLKYLLKWLALADLSIDDERSNLEMPTNVVQFVFLLLFEPLEVSKLEPTLGKQRHKQTF